MKKYLLGLAAIVLAVGFSAFTTVKQKGFTTYYAIKSGSAPLTWTWETSVPQGFTCLSEAGGPTCTTIADSRPDDNSAPSGINGQLYKE